MPQKMATAIFAASPGFGRFFTIFSLIFYEKYGQYACKLLYIREADKNLWKG